MIELMLNFEKNLDEDEQNLVIGEKIQLKREDEIKIGQVGRGLVKEEN